MRKVRRLFNEPSHKWEGNFTFNDPENDVDLSNAAEAFLTWMENEVNNITNKTLHLPSF